MAEVRADKTSWHACFLFFFSSRRRHTRSLCDWSSDVCSSDLHVGRQARAILDDARERATSVLGCKPSELVFTSGGTESANLAIFGAARLLKPKGRSEERRVGKECRSRWSPYH